MTQSQQTMMQTLDVNCGLYRIWKIATFNTTGYNVDEKAGRESKTTNLSSYHQNPSSRLSDISRLASMMVPDDMQ